MTEQFSITPPPELIKNWHDEWNESDQIVHSAYTHIALCAAQWGADQELEACCETLSRWGVQGLHKLRAARRPKPPSLKEQALDVLSHVQKAGALQILIQTPSAAHWSSSMTDLSPQAQAVLDAYLSTWPDEPMQQDRICLAAALRAAADQLGIELEFYNCKVIEVEALHALANELEAQ